MKSSELFRILIKDGWFVVRQSGSHRILKHPSKKGNIIIPYHGAKEVKTGLLNSI